jgi:hypothetical protein
VDDDGTVRRGSKYGKAVGFVDEDGTVRVGSKYGKAVGHAELPRRLAGGAAFLLLLR